MKHALSVTRAENFPDWYQDVVQSAEMAETSSSPGSMIIKPWGFAIWEIIQARLDRLIKDTGHQNCYFPMLIPLELIQKEATHVDGFAKEMAVVTHHRVVNRDGKLVPDGELEMPLVLRPTSETIIGESMAKWINSYRDLPLKLNQWCNVFRWELRTRLFLRTREFLWQEGHTAHASAEEAKEEVSLMLECYRQVIEDDMRIPSIAGEKPPHERFAGAVETHALESMMQDGRALQSATSHYLGQNFANAAGIKYQDKEGGVKTAFTTSWGLTTRIIGAMIMTHGDDDGLRLPPRIAPKHVVIIPILRDEAAKADVLARAEQLKQALKATSYDGEPIRCEIDLRDDQPANKRWSWIKKGVPIICELGPRDLANNSIAYFRRDKLEGKATFLDIISPEAYGETMREILSQIHDQLYQDAKAYRETKTNRDLKTPDEMRAYFNQDQTGFVIGKWSGSAATEALLKEFGVTIRCLPYDQTGGSDKCLVTGEDATVDAVYAKAY